MKEDSKLQCPKCKSTNQETEVDGYGGAIVTCRDCGHRGDLFGIEVGGRRPPSQEEE